MDGKLFYYYFYWRHTKLNFLASNCLETFVSGSFGGNCTRVASLADVSFYPITVRIHRANIFFSIRLQHDVFQWPHVDVASFDWASFDWTSFDWARRIRVLTNQQRSTYNTRQFKKSRVSLSFHVNGTYLAKSNSTLERSSWMLSVKIADKQMLKKRNVNTITKKLRSKEAKKKRKTYRNLLHFLTFRRQNP